MSTNRNPSRGRSSPTRADGRARRAPEFDPRLGEIEAVARIGSYASDLAAGHWASSPGLDAIFGIGATFDRSVEGWASLIHPDDREAMVAYFAEDVVARHQAFDREYRIIRPETGEERWVHGLGRLELDASGRPVRLFGTIADITNQRRAQEALARSELRYATIFEGALEAILIAEQASKRFRWVNAAASALLGYTRDEFNELTIRDIHPPDAVPAILEQFEARIASSGVSRSVPCVRKDGTLLVADIKASAAEIDGVPCLVGFFSDVTELRNIEAHDRQLAQAIEQTSDSVIIADLAGTIEYANPAFERMSGYSREDVIGQNPRILKSGRQSASFYRALWRRLVRGRSWSGTLFNRRKDGTLYEVEATISPLRKPDGEHSGYVGVERDVTALRAAESALAAEFRERAQAAAALARLQPGPTAEATAADICDELLALPGFDVAAIFDFRGPRRAVTLAAGGPDGMPVSAGRPLPGARAGYLYQRAQQGPWAEMWRPREEDGDYGQAMAVVGVKAVAYAPVRNGDGLLGVVAAGTRDAAFAQHLIEHLPVVGEFAATASALLSRPLESSHRSDLVKQRMKRILADRSFSPVFQPISTLVSNAEPVGYEALTRFADGTPPARMFAEAHSVGMGLDLEVACLTAALAAAETLSPECWLSLNVSPEVILDMTELSTLLAGQSRTIVLEVTEHAEVGNYRAMRHAFRRLGPTVRLAVDDAGSGFASLRHVVELRPQFLKLDVSLVRHVDRDLTRQAMVAGLTRFAQRARCEVIAEGIEERAELEMLRELGVSFGQGYLLGRPKSVSTISGSSGRHGRPRRRRSVATGRASSAADT
jgi:PAS domain S-box-containing protein